MQEELYWSFWPFGAGRVVVARMMLLLESGKPRRRNWDWKPAIFLEPMLVTPRIFCPMRESGV